MFYYYWMIGEIVFIILLFVFIIFRIQKNDKDQAGKTSIPETPQGRAAHYAKRLFHLLGFGLGILSLLVIIISFERTVISAFMEMEPTPSEVTIPSDLGFEVEEVTFKSEDGITLSGWFTPSQNGATVILLHGYGGNRTNMIWHAQQLVRAGYGVLMYDERASGESTGEYRSYGWEDTRDTKAAIQFIHSRNTNEHIGAMGCSSGADILVYSAALYPEIEAVWGDGNSSVRAQDLPKPTNPLMALLIGSNYMVDWLYTIKIKTEAPVPMTQVLPNIAPRPVMFVGGRMKRPIVGSEEELFTLRFASLTGTNAQTWIIDEATHCDGPLQIPDEYAEKMAAFFDKAFDIKR